VAAGRTNRQIAEQLFTSITVGVHVTRILAKLGVADPGEAAALAHHEVRTTTATTAHRTLRPNQLLAGGESAHEPETGHRHDTRLPILRTRRTADYGYEAGDGPPRRISMTAESSCRPSPARRPARYSCSAADASGAG
jgi:Bacterial regulatory proteins, luxR family